MGLIEFRFLFFAAAVVFIYYILPGRCQWLVLLAASLVFYMTYGWTRIPFVVISAMAAYMGAKKMEMIRQCVEDAGTAKKQCRRVLEACIAVIVSLLVYAKIGTWVIRSMAAFLPWEQGKTMEAVVALGISYYTFSLVSYLADVYWKKDKAEKNFLRLLLFAIYFPKVLQGPISRHKNLALQLWEEHRFDYREFCFGLQLMVWGYFKKMVIADRMAILVNTVFDNIGNETGAHLLVASCFSVFQLYCDFSGCMDIAGGFSQVLGLRLEANFNHPFFSKSVAEFWRRWHITLGTWFKDYIYMPLVISPRMIRVSQKVRKQCGMRAGRAVMMVIPLAVVWLLTGLWHGTGWNYIVWGAYWGGMIIISNIFAPEMKKLTAFLRINTETGSWKLFQMVRIFCLFMVSRMLTAPGDLRKSGEIFRRILLEFHPEGFFDGSLYTIGLDRPNFILAVVCILVLWSVAMLQERSSVRERIAGSNIVFRWMIYYIAIFAVLIFGIYGPGYDVASFIYMNF